MSFVIAYVPQVDNVSEVEQVNNVSVVEEVKKLPHPAFPLKKYNFQLGGVVEIVNSYNMFESVYTPQHDCEFKGLSIVYDTYNIEDKYNILVGSRYVIKDARPKEMAEHRLFNTFEVVPSGTPIVIQHINNSGKAKTLMYDLQLLFDSVITQDGSQFNWTFNWNGESVNIPEGDTCILIVNVPPYVNMGSNISTFNLDLTNTNTELDICTITCGAGGSITSNYIETDPLYQGQGFLARSNVIAVTNVTRYDKSIHIVFKNINTTGMPPHPIEIGISGSVVNL